MATIVTRAGKGSPLTNNEVDANFTNLNSDKLESGDTVASLTITSADINGGTIDGVTIGGASAGAATFTSATVNGNITVTGTVDGRDVATDGTKLDGIEAGADVTGTTNVTAAGALMDSELTNITAVKALDQGVATTDSPAFAGLSVNSNPIATAGSLSNRNKIINGAMQVAQRGTNFAGGTANADDAYTLDRWYVLSEGSDSVDVDQVADSPDTGGKSIRLDVETTGEKFGIAQIVEAINCTGLIGNTVTLSFAAKVSDARIDTVKAAIVAWSGTADTVTSDIISAWNADGTTPTLVANATFENTPADLSVTTSWAKYEITASVDTASAANIVVFIWSDDATNPLAGDFLYITGVQLEAGDTATPFEHRSYGQELALCQRYYETGGNQTIWGGNTTSGSPYYMFVRYSVTKRAAPTVVTTLAAASGFDSSNPAVTSQADVFSANKAANAIASGAYFQFSWTASAEL